MVYIKKYKGVKKKKKELRLWIRSSNHPVEERMKETCRE